MTRTQNATKASDLRDRGTAIGPCLDRSDITTLVSLLRNALHTLPIELRGSGAEKHLATLCDKLADLPNRDTWEVGAALKRELAELYKRDAKVALSMAQKFLEDHPAPRDVDSGTEMAPRPDAHDLLERMAYQEARRLAIQQAFEAGAKSVRDRVRAGPGDESGTQDANEGNS